MASGACPVALEIVWTAPLAELHPGPVSPEAFSVTVRNLGKREVVLVRPGDGSDVGWRTPIVRWELARDGQLVPPVSGAARCGNINALERDEVFALAPGASQALGGWLPELFFATPGSYSVRLRYENNPGLEWEGLALGEHDAAAMKRLRKSAACKVASNAITVTVVAKP